MNNKDDLNEKNTKLFNKTYDEVLEDMVESYRKPPPMTVFSYEEYKMLRRMEENKDD